MTPLIGVRIPTLELMPFKTYEQFISNIAYRYKFKVVEEDGTVFKEENGERTILASPGEYHPDKLWWKVWLKLQEEYGYSGIWKQKQSFEIRQEREQESCDGY